MSESAKNLAGVKIATEDHAWFEDEQLRVRNARGKKPTQAEMFRLMKDAYIAQGLSFGHKPDKKSKVYTIPVTSKQQQCYDLVSQIFRNGTQDRITSLHEILEALAAAAKVKLDDEGMDRTRDGQHPVDSEPAQGGNSAREGKRGGR